LSNQFDLFHFTGKTGPLMGPRFAIYFTAFKPGITRLASESQPSIKQYTVLLTY